MTGGITFDSVLPWIRLESKRAEVCSKYILTNIYCHEVLLIQLKQYGALFLFLLFLQGDSVAHERHGGLNPS